MESNMAVKQPQDHKDKAPIVESVEVTLGKGGDARTVKARRVTIDGITVTVADEALDDFELLDDLAQLENKKATKLPAVARRLFGDSYGDVLESLRGANGRVPIEKASKFIGDVFGALNPN